MNICLITEYSPETKAIEIRGGVEARAYHLAQELAKRHTVYVITSSERTDRQQRRLGKVNVIVCSRHRYTHQGALFSRLTFAWHAYRSWKLLKDKNIQIVDGCNFISYLPAYFLAKKLNAKKIATYHEVWQGEWTRNKGFFTGIFGSIWESFVLHRSWDKIIAVSDFTKKKLEHYFPLSKLAIVPNGVDLGAYRAKAAKFPQPTVCCVSRLTPQKRVIDLIEAIALLKEHIPSVRCKIIGVGAEQEKLQQRAKALGISDHVQFLGFIRKHSEVVKAIKQSHVLCLPSVVEGFGIIVLEAMASGIPYICTDIPPLKEITNNGKGGLLAHQYDPAHLAAQLRTLLEDKRLLERKSKEGLVFVQRYAWQQQARKLEQVYSEVMHR